MLLKLLHDSHLFFIVTRNHDLGRSEPFLNTSATRFLPFEHSFVKHVSNFFDYLRSLSDAKSFDLVYLNSFFSFFFTFFPLVFIRLFLGFPASRIVIAPRGELLDGALSRKYFKKIIYLYVFKLLFDYKSFVWHFTSVCEYKSSSRLLPGIKTYHLISNPSSLDLC